MSILSVTKDQQLVNLVNDSYDESEKVYSPLYQTKWDNWDDLFYGVPEEKKYDWQSNLFIPATYRAVMTILCRCVNTHFPNGELPINVLPREESDRGGEEPVKNLLVYQIDRAEIYRKWMLNVLQCLVRGTSVIKVFWDKDVRNRKVNEPIYLPTYGADGTITQKLTGYQAVTKEFVTHDDPNFEVVDLKELYLDPTATEFDKSYKIHKIITKFDYLKRQEMLGNYQNISAIVNSSFPSQTGLTRRHFLNLGINNPSYNAEYTDKEKKTSSSVELLEAEIGFDINGDGLEENCIVTMANRTVLIRAEENPYWHGESNYINIVFMPVLKEIYGMGMCEIIEPLQAELNTKRNQRIDNINVMLQSVLEYVEGAIDPMVIKNFVRKPGAMLPVKSLEATRWDTPPNYTATYVNEETMINRDIEETTGATKELQPSAASGEMHRTATGIALLQGAAGERVKLVIQLMEQMGIGKLLQRFHQMNQQFITEERSVRILGKEGYTFPKVSPEDVGHNYDFVPAGSSSVASKEIQLAQLNRFLEITSRPDPPPVPGTVQVNKETLYKRIWEAMGFQDSKEIITRVPIPPPSPGGMPPGAGGQAPPGQGGNPMVDMIKQMAESGAPVEEVMAKLQEQGGGGNGGTQPQG